jgi:hypothetical protein
MPPRGRAGAAGCWPRRAPARDMARSYSGPRTHALRGNIPEHPRGGLGARRSGPPEFAMCGQCRGLESGKQSEWGGTVRFGAAGPAVATGTLRLLAPLGAAKNLHAPTRDWGGDGTSREGALSAEARMW